VPSLEANNITIQNKKEGYKGIKEVSQI